MTITDTFIWIRHAYFEVKVEVTLRLTVNQSACLGIEHLCGTCNQILLPVRRLLSSFCGAPSLTRIRSCNLQCNHSMVRVAQNQQPYFSVSSETPATWRARFPNLYPPGTGWPSYTSGHCIRLFRISVTFRPAMTP
jgi:hypothetical protein